MGIPINKKLWLKIKQPSITVFLSEERHDGTLYRRPMGGNKVQYYLLANARYGGGWYKLKKITTYLARVD